MLAQQEPDPAFVVDRRWNRCHSGGQRFVGFLTDTSGAPDWPSLSTLPTRS
jgi:hypothetical protein